MMRKAICIPAALLLLVSCNSFLEEHPRDQKTEGEVVTDAKNLYLATLGNLYSLFGGTEDSQGIQGTYRGLYDFNTFTTDEALIPTRGGDWYDGGFWQRLYLHTWEAGDSYLNATWNYLYKVIVMANRSLQTVAEAGKAGMIGSEEEASLTAEIRAVRAYFYYYLLDMFGRVPIVDRLDANMNSLTQSSRSEVFNFVRNELLECYLDHLEQHIPVDRQQFKAYFNAFSLIRIMQAMGAYGYRGYFERKAHFLQSVPYAIRNMRYLLEQNALPEGLPELRRVLQTVVESYVASKPGNPDMLTVTVQSFSYKKGIPEDTSGNGGGFVFDCRALPNPGREKQYATFTGKDDCVIRYLEQYPEVETFVGHVCALVDMSVDNYLERKFTHLTVNFGCTGGQHRSVYFAERTARHLREKYPAIAVELVHREQ